MSEKTLYTFPFILQGRSKLSSSRKYISNVPPLEGLVLGKQRDEVGKGWKRDLNSGINSVTVQLDGIVTDICCANICILGLPKIFPYSYITFSLQTLECRTLCWRSFNIAMKAPGFGVTENQSLKSVSTAN